MGVEQDTKRRGCRKCKVNEGVMEEGRGEISFNSFGSAGARCVFEWMQSLLRVEQNLELFLSFLFPFLSFN